MVRFKEDAVLFWVSLEPALRREEVPERERERES